MISHEDIKNLVNEWRLREDIIEKDYVIGWMLWGIGSDPETGSNWIFKGGTCLKKCFIETYRFSEDLDFTVLPGGLIKPDELSSIIERILTRVAEESGIDFSLNTPMIKRRESPLSVEIRIYYRGPRNTPTPASIKLDLSASEKVVLSPILREIAHPYSDNLPAPAQMRCYVFEELFAEKIRAMAERSRPRDLYDIINIYRRINNHTQPEFIQPVLIEKCKTKEIPVPDFISIENSPFIDELKSEWENMLGHQLPELPPFEQFWRELPQLFSWLEGTYTQEKFKQAPIQKDEDTTWIPPSTISSWGIGIPIESIRFAAANHLCVELQYRKKGYETSYYLIEPYSLRRTMENNLILHAIKVDTQEDRAFHVDWIQSIKITNKTFKPRYQIEFEPIGPVMALPTSRKSSPAFYGYSSGVKKQKNSDPAYIFECLHCGRKFKKSKYDSRLNPHKDKNGKDCFGRTGYFVEIRY